MTTTLNLAAPAPLGAAAEAPRAPGPEAARHAAAEFEAIFIAQMLNTMTRDLAGDAWLGDGHDQAIFHDMLNEQVASLISRTGGIGVADAVMREMLKAQEIA